MEKLKQIILEKGSKKFITYLLLIKKEKFNRGRNFIPDLFRWKLQNKCR